MPRVPEPTVEQLRADMTAAMQRYLRDVDRIAVTSRRELECIEDIHSKLITLERSLREAMYG